MMELWKSESAEGGTGNWKLSGYKTETRLRLLLVMHSCLFYQRQKNVYKTLL